MKRTCAHCRSMWGEGLAAGAMPHYDNGVECHICGMTVREAGPDVMIYWKDRPAAAEFKRYFGREEARSRRGDYRSVIAV